MSPKNGKEANAGKEDCSKIAVQALEKADVPQTERRSFTKEERDYMWNKADKVPGMDPAKFRVDKCGNLMYYDAYGISKNPDEKTKLAYDGDHSLCLKHGGTYHKNNLQALQSNQNRHKSDTVRYDYKGAPRFGITPDEYKAIKTDIDKRCSLYKNGLILLNEDGTIYPKSEAVANGSITLNKDHTVRKNCRAINTYQLSFKQTSACDDSPRKILEGPRGGLYHINENGNKSYFRPSTSSTSYASLSSGPYRSMPTGQFYSSNGSANGREIFSGPRGGNFYLSSFGTRQYI